MTIGTMVSPLQELSKTYGVTKGGGIQRYLDKSASTSMDEDDIQNEEEVEEGGESDSDDSEGIDLIDRLIAKTRMGNVIQEFSINIGIAPHLQNAYVGDELERSQQEGEDQQMMLAKERAEAVVQEELLELTISKAYLDRVKNVVLHREMGFGGCMIILELEAVCARIAKQLACSQEYFDRVKDVVFKMSKRGGGGRRML